MTEQRPAGPAPEPLLSLSGIEKSFGGIHALRGVTFDLRAGEVHALVGENGAGKSTLIKIITGAYSADDGTIQVDDRVFGSLDPQLARSLGIGVVYQEFNLLPDLTVAENILLANPPKGRLGLIDLKGRARKAAEYLDRLGAKSIDPNRLAGELTVGEQQVVEIAKALATDARILIMDEPSAVLPSRDLDRLFSVIRILREQGHGIIYISHRLDEIFELADRVTVLKDGQTMGTRQVSETTNNELVRMMVGRALGDMYPPRDAVAGAVLLEARALDIEDVVWDVNLTVRAGEVVGLAGLGGSGRTTVCRSLVGLGRIRNGTVRFLGKPGPKSAAAAAREGLVLIPEDRKSHGLVLNQSIRFNLSLPTIGALERFGMVRGGLEKQAVGRAISDIQIRPATPGITAENLSGGNQQKIVVGKWLLANPKLVIFDEPTRGIDVGAKAEIYLRIRELTRRGVGVLMASSELPELIGLADRIIVFHEGRVAGELVGPTFSEEEIMALATSTGTPEAASAGAPA